jgi:glycosyltransferase involved in cell wall biosynthesis
MFLSGNGNWVAEQVRSLRDEGVKVDVLFFDTKRTRLYYGTKLPEIVRALRRNRYDLVHTHHSYTLFMADLARRVAMAGVPVVLTNHEAEALDAMGRTRTWHPTSYLRHSRALKRFAARRADAVIFVARQLATELHFDRPYDVIPCGVDLSKFRPLNRSECRRRLGVPGSTPTIFFPANPHNQRKRFALAEAAHAIIRQRWPNALLRTGGGISADDMVYHYCAADVMLQTSYCEASPTVVKEALACEIPVVSTDSGDTADIIRGVPYCALCPEDPAALAARIMEAHGHHAVGGRAHLISHGLDLRQVARRIIAVYERAVATAAH